MPHDLQHHEPAGEVAFSGKILIAGAAFLVIAAQWFLLGFFRWVDGDESIAILNFVLAGLHLLTGPAVLRRRRWSFTAGLALALAGMVASIPNEYSFPIVADGATLILLVLASSDLHTHQA